MNLFAKILVGAALICAAWQSSAAVGGVVSGTPSVGSDIATNASPNGLTYWEDFSRWTGSNNLTKAQTWALPNGVRTHILWGSTGNGTNETFIKDGRFRHEPATDNGTYAHLIITNTAGRPFTRAGARIHIDRGPTAASGFNGTAIIIMAGRGCYTRGTNNPFDFGLGTALHCTVNQDYAFVEFFTNGVGSLVRLAGGQISPRLSTNHDHVVEINLAGNYGVMTVSGYRLPFYSPDLTNAYGDFISYEIGNLSATQRDWTASFSEIWGGTATEPLPRFDILRLPWGWSESKSDPSGFADSSQWLSPNGITNITLGGRAYAVNSAAIQTATTEINLHACVLQTNSLFNTMDSIEWEASGKVVNSANAKTLKAYLGAQQLFSSGAILLSNSWRMVGTLSRTASGSQLSTVTFFHGGPTPQTHLNVTNVSATLSTTNGLRITGTCAVANEITNSTLIVKGWPATR
jgi:hypothetical protein